MSKTQRTNKIISIVVGVLAISYLVYRLVAFDDYQTLTDYFRSVGWREVGLLMVAICLFPVNILAEAIKWRYLVRNIQRLSLAQAQRHTYFGFAAAFITPARLGDFPARASLLDDRSQVVAAITLGFFGSFALASLQIVLGIPAALMSVGVGWYVYLIAVALIVAYAALPTIARVALRHEHKSKQWRTTLDQLTRLSWREQIVILLLSAMRYVVYVCQMVLILWACGIHFAFADMLGAILTYYMLVTVTPSVPVADAAVRGSWAILVFGRYVDNAPTLALAAIMLWIINVMLPMLVGVVGQSSRLRFKDPRSRLKG